MLICIRLKAMRPSRAPWTRLGVVWVSIFWFILAVSISVSQYKHLDTEPKVFKTCGENVTLNCNASEAKLKDSKIFKFDWQHKSKTLCQYMNNTSTDKIKCNFTNTTSQLTLSLTILNIIPSDDGNYHCKLHSGGGIANGQSHLKVGDCFGKPGKDTPSDQCSFEEVFPIADIHWFQGDVNLTDGTETKQNVDDKGYFTVQSTAPTERGNQSQPYNCSLWMPSLNKYISSRMVSSGSTTQQLQWICIMMGILMKIIIM
ncbi:PREDICTED: uncharacterized protein LOC106906709 isoform X1 [Poecilia mexicana]|uniref:uncharacterized protein LOC106906709 isoform X1 n=2 Tax=Poecilia mexicana TaxID=48701 RepID=UPI00072EA91C|nr:PREDICTED: uncharacterized protein LOC106906709 isoform X1 [Poecilia mexicana]XP_014827598.1 PREDICTED: uncharacterized protein LOC106906709 isoform X1 [Poecilia mexicana]